MSEQLALAFFDESTSSAEGFLVRTSARQGEGEASQAHGRGSGRISRGLSAKSGRGSSSSKTSRCFADEALALSSPTFPRAGMTLRGTAFPLPPSAPLTGATGSSWSPGESLARVKSWDGTTPGERVARAKMWPSPTCSDGKGGPGTSKHRKGGLNLRTAVANWPTPTTSDARSSRRHGYMQQGHAGTTLTDAIDSHHQQATREPGKPGAHQVDLNPEFVEALMGFPPGWTEMLGSEPSATPSCRKSRKRSGV